MILAIGGAYAARDALALPIVLVCGIVAALAGETTGFVLGRRYGDCALSAIPGFSSFRGPPRSDRADDRATRCHRHRPGPLRDGRRRSGSVRRRTSGVSWSTFVRFAYPTTAAWAIAVVSFGYLVGNNVDLIDRVLSAIGWAGLSVIAVVLLAWRAIRRRRTRAAAKR